MDTENSRGAKGWREYNIPAFFTIRSNKLCIWELWGKRIFFVIILMWAFTCSFGQTAIPIKIDSIVFNMSSTRSNRSCDTTRMPTEIKEQQIDVIVCRAISYLKDSSICLIEVERNDFFTQKCDEFYFLGRKLIKANVLLINRGGVVWDRQIYFDEDKEIRQDGHGQRVVANHILLNAYKIRDEAMEKK